MTANALENPPSGEPEHSLAGWGWFVILGALLIALGLFALAYMGLATVASILTIGVLMIVGGIAHVVLAFRGEDWRRFLPLVLGGILYLLAGVLVLFNPLLASAVLTFVIACALLAVGATRLWFGFKARFANGSGWIVVTGVVTLLLGVIMVIGWPVDSLWVIGMFLGVDLLLQGWSYLAFGLALRARA